MISPLYAARYAQLNPRQKEAVDTIEGPVMVIAGPGTGKTTILTLRIARILQETDTPPSGILAITFTDAGVKAMRSKLKDLIGERAHEVRIHTFHSFASSVIAEFKDHFVHLDRSRQITEIEAENLIRNILEKEHYRPLRPFGNPDFYLSKILGSISDCMREGQTPEMVRSFVAEERARVETDPSFLSTRGSTKGELKAEGKKLLEKCDRTLLFAEVYEEYVKEKRLKKLIDFDDLIGEVIIALKSDELLLRLLQEKFLYILIDEHQDTNDSQNELVRLLADFFDVPNVFIVGDEKQAIYRFQGASVENFLRFEHSWKGIKMIRLEDNYRSHQRILDGSYAMIEHNYEDGQYESLRTPLKSHSEEEPRPIEVVAAGDTAAAEAYLVSSLKEILAREPHATVALITKTNRDLERVTRLCDREGIPVVSQRSIDIFAHPVGTVFFDLAEYFVDPERADLLAKTISAGLWSVPFDQAVEVIRVLKSGKHSGLEKKLPGLVKIRKELLNDSPIDFLMTLAEESGFVEIASRDPGSAEVWRGIVYLAESIVRDGSLKSPRELLQRLVSYRASAEMKSVKIALGTPDLTVHALTAHGSKGLEFDYVFIPYATEDSWAGRNWGNYFVLPETRAQNDIRDVRRLFYVALTRARRHVTILYGTEEQGTELLPFRCIEELDPAEISQVHLPKLSVPVTRPAPSGKSTRAQKYIDIAKTVLATNGLSVTALNHFLVCPSRFLYQSILKLPQRPAASAEKGTAMHLLFSRVWLEQNRTRERIEELGKETFESFFNDSLLPTFEKNAVKRELMDILPTVAQELEPHFNISGAVYTETWCEAEYRVPLHGKLDAIVDQADEVKVFDYKTKQVMTENEIRGNTKNSRGEYFRQLVFYRLLLENDSRYKHKRISPALVFVVPNEKGKCPTVALPIGHEDIVKVKKDIDALVDAVDRGDIVSKFCDDASCEWCRLKRLVV